MSTIAAAEPAPRPGPAPMSTRAGFPGWLALVAAVPLLMIANGRYSIWVAAWLAPVLLLRFARDGRAWIRLPVLHLLLCAGFAFQFKGMVPIPGWGYLAFLLLNGLPMTAPYAVDRLLFRPGAGLSSSLAFPAAWAGTEFLYSLGPYGSWGSIAYSQYGNLPLVQIVSVTGLWGITFLIGLLASVCNWTWEQRTGTGARWGALSICLTGLGAVFVAGGLRMVMMPPAAPAVRVASLTQPKAGPDLDANVFARLVAGRADESDTQAVQRWTAGVNEGLLARAEQEARAGAKILFWGEGNAVLLKADEAAFLERGRALAREHQVYLGMAVAVWNRDRTPPLENKMLLIRPDGDVAWEFYKAHPLPGGEAAISATGDGALRVTGTPDGRLSAVICFDADFPRLLQQAGALRTDILLDPSNDWREIDPWHTQMASFRAIEQGFNLVRHTSNGLSAAFDYQGRMLASMDHFQTSDRVLVAQVPTRGVRTLYSRVGDLFAGTCLALLPMLGVRRLWAPGARPLSGRWRRGRRR